jgi:hypothetical protein
MHSSRFTTVVLWAAVAWLVASCAGTKLSSVWKDPAYQKTPRKIVVLSLVWDPNNRKRVDQVFVRQIKARGLDAVAGYEIVPESPLPERATIAARVKETEADTLLFAKLMDKESSLRYVQEAGHYEGNVYNTWPDYYGAGYVTAVDPEYAIVEVKLFDVETEQLIWSAMTKTQIRSDRQASIEAYAAGILDALHKERLIPGPK